MSETEALTAEQQQKLVAAAVLADYTDTAELSPEQEKMLAILTTEVDQAAKDAACAALGLAEDTLNAAVSGVKGLLNGIFDGV